MTRKLKLLKLAFWLLITGGAGTLCLFAGISLYLNPKLPQVETLRQIQLQTPLRVFSSDGLLIGEFGEKRRTPIAIQDTPEAFIQAILAAEDGRFYSHPGVDLKGLLRAASQLLQSGHIRTGGSTITMQVARNFFLTRKQTFTRKFNEILLALQIEKELSKEEILELYINKIYLGNRAYGIEAAAQVYYGKSIRDLTLAQLAMIAGLPKAPSAYNPIINPDRALIRRNWILSRMRTLNYILDDEYDTATQEPVTAAYHGSRVELDAPYVAEMARKEALRKLGPAAYTDGFKVYTSINAKLQARAQRAVINGLLTYDQRHGYRGPEAQLIETPSSEQPLDSEAEPISNDTLTSWQTALKSYKTIGGLTPSVVTQVNPQSIDLLMADGTRTTLNWEDGLASARAYINENRRRSAPKKASDIVKRGSVIRVKKNDENRWQLSQIPTAQAALVALNPLDGSIIALTGGFDFNQSHFNRATQAERQPGSNFKPFIYAAALENGLTPATVINDAPIVFDDASLEGTWRPENDGGRFYGPTRLRKALYKSRNLVSIRILRTIGVKTAIRGMARYGFNEDRLPRDLSLSLGTHAMTPLQVATGYAVFANGGYQVTPYLVQKIDNMADETIFEALPATVCRACEISQEQQEGEQQIDNAAQEQDLEQLESELIKQMAQEGLPNEEGTMAEADEELSPPTQKPLATRVMSPQVAYQIDDILRDVVAKGTGRKAKSLGRADLAGKTGTTNGPKDAWFSGYNHHIVATTWLGFDQNSPLGRREYGGTSALPIWIDFMEAALKGVPEAERSLPEGLVSVRINPDTGKRARANTPNAIFELFKQEDIPEFGVDEAPRIDSSADTSRDALPEELF